MRTITPTQFNQLTATQKAYLHGWCAGAGQAVKLDAEQLIKFLQSHGETQESIFYELTDEGKQFRKEFDGGLLIDGLWKRVEDVILRAELIYASNSLKKNRGHIIADLAKDCEDFEMEEPEMSAWKRRPFVS